MMHFIIRPYPYILTQILVYSDMPILKKLRFKGLLQGLRQGFSALCAWDFIMAFMSISPWTELFTFDQQLLMLSCLVVVRNILCSQHGILG